MRIFSNFSDYYDTARGYGIDPNIIYNRETKEYWNNFRPRTKEYNSFRDKHQELISIFEGRERINYDLCSEFGVICFCGKEYPFIRSINNSVSYNTDDVIKNTDINFDFNKQRVLYGKSYYQLLDEFFEIKSLDKDIHKKYNSPIIIISSPIIFGHIIVVNPQLKKYEFYKMFDPFSCFQEISMFLGNYFGAPGNETVEIADKDRIAMHGFDKHSFRNSKR